MCMSIKHSKVQIIDHIICGKLTMLSTINKHNHCQSTKADLNDSGSSFCSMTTPSSSAFLKLSNVFQHINIQGLLNCVIYLSEGCDSIYFLANSWALSLSAWSASAPTQTNTSAPVSSSIRSSVTRSWSNCHVYKVGLITDIPSSNLLLEIEDFIREGKGPKTEEIRRF